MRVCATITLVLLLFVMPAWADQGGIPHNPHEAIHTTVVGITNEAGKVGVFDTATLGVWGETTNEDGHLVFTYRFSSVDGYEILANDGSGEVLGYVHSLEYDGNPDPQVLLNFSVRAASTDATFSFTSAIGVIPAIIDPIAKASASVTLTDTSTAIPPNGAYINGSFGGDCYQARYNNGTVFTSLVGSDSTVGGQKTWGENDPGDGVSYRPVGGTVTQMEAEYRFVLKKYDSASGTSNFTMLGTAVPEPASMLGLATGLAGFFGFAMRKRR